MRASLILVVILVACSSPQEDRIVVPKLHASFYDEALIRINNRLDDEPDNQKLIEQKLFYCDQLGWPTTCISALDSYYGVHGMSNQLVRQYITYYAKHERFDFLLTLFDKWDNEYSIKNEHPRLYIQSLVSAGKKKRALAEIQSYLIDNQEQIDVEFAARQYLELGDTPMTVYYLGKLYKLDPKSELMWEYGKLLNQLGYVDLSFQVIGDYATDRKDDLSIQLAYASMLNNANRNVEARNALKPFLKKDTVAYQLAEFYQKDFHWDSAGYVLADVISRDSTNRKPIWKMGRLYEERGWFSSSLLYFDYLVKLNPADSLAAHRIELIQRKIAYLQRLKFEEAKLPTLELKPKTIKN